MHRPPYRSAAPGDTLGARHLDVALADVAYPQTTSELVARYGRWRMPITGVEFEPLAAWLDGVPEQTFRSPAAVVDAVVRAHPELKES